MKTPRSSPLLLAIAAALLLMTACGPSTVRPRSYLALPVDAEGRLPSNPYVVEHIAGKKHVAIIGTLHNAHPTDPMYSAIASVFARVRPQLVLHESSTPQSVPSTPEQAIREGGGIGYAAYLARAHGAELRSADAPERDEFAALLAKYPPEVVLVFLTAQRLLGGYNPDLIALGAEYPAFYEEYLVANGVPLRESWRTWSGLVAAYASVVGRQLTAEDWDPDRVSPIRDLGRLNEVARTASEFRDRRLLAAVHQGLEQHDRVVVVFGGWHVLALEPILRRLPDRLDVIATHQ